MRYQWIANQFANPYGDAAEIYQHLEHLRSQDDLTIDRVIEDAKRRDSPLHGKFEWDDKSAAAKYRRRQAASVMCQIVKVNEKGEAARIYMGVRGADGEARHYDLVSRVMKNPQLRRPYARRALMELTNWKARYGDVPELKRTLAAVEKQLKRVIAPALAQLEATEE